MCVTESAPIQDRSEEHLSSQDGPLVFSRKLLLKGLKDVAEGRDPLGILRDVEFNSFPRPFAYTLFEPKDVDWKEWIKEVERKVGSTTDILVPSL